MYQIKNEFKNIIYNKTLVFEIFQNIKQGKKLSHIKRKNKLNKTIN